MVGHNFNLNYRIAVSAQTILIEYLCLESHNVVVLLHNSNGQTTISLTACNAF